MNDLKFALRQLLKNPGFTAVAVLTLALGIGATTALFSVVYGVLINPYPYAKPDEIWALGLRTASSDETVRPYRLGEYRELAKLPAFSDVMATRPGEMLLGGVFAPETLPTVRVSGNAMGFLGVPPVLGRAIGPGDITASGEAQPVTVLSFRLWQRLFDGRADVVGQALRLDDESYTIIGVMPPRFGWWTSDGAWFPLGMDSRDQRGVFPIGRLKPGVALAVAEQQWRSLQLQLAKANPSGFPKEEWTSTLTNYLDVTAASGELENSLRLLFGAVGFLLLIACANVANLQLARASSRAREMAVRLALGAHRGRLVRQLLTESVLLSLVGGGLGLVFALGITRLMVVLMPSFYIPGEARIEVNGTVLLFCVSISMLTGILFGLVPAFQSSRPNLTDALKDEGRGSSAAAGGKIRAALVVVEVALSVVLLVSAGLTIRGFISLQQVELGFQPDGVLTVDLPLQPKRYATWEQRNRFAGELLDRVLNLPGVEAASVGNGGLPFGGLETTYAINGQAAPESRRIFIHLASADYLKTFGIPLRHGRMFTAREADDADRYAVINEAAAKLWPAGEDPVGRSIRLDELGKANPGSMRTPTNSSPNVMIIGVIGDTQNDGLRNEPRPAILLPYTLAAPAGRDLAIRTRGDPGQLMTALRAQVREMDSEQPLQGPNTLVEAVANQTVQPRFTMALFSLFAAFGLALAMAGIYSVLSYLVTRRTREIGVRMALGAGRGDVQRLFLKAGCKLVGLGLAIGLFAAVAVARFLASRIELFHVTAFDPVSMVGVVMLLGFVGLAACYVPARRATRVDPMVALRSE
jgi:predicted permease